MGKCCQNAKHFTCLIREQKLIFMDFVTLITRMESILNSRLLVLLSNDPSELNALTSSHFLIGQARVTLPEENLVDIPQN